MATVRMNEYRIIWILLFFDLPTETKKERRIYAKFRKNLLQSGFVMFQFSVYLRHCASIESANVHIRRVQRYLPEKGSIGMVTLTDKQFGDMEIFYGKKNVSLNIPVQQLELF